MVREEGLEIEGVEGPTLVPYASIQNIKVGGRLADPVGFRKASCPIAVLHDGRVLHIPSRLNFPSHEVYRFLAERIPDGGGRDVNPVLADYLERQEQYFGPDSVATFRAASGRATGARLGYRAFCIGVTVAGAAWMVYGFSGFGETMWGGVGVACAVAGILLYTVSFAESLAAGSSRKLKDASLVIGPQGMAMVQGDIQGEVRWPELLEIRFNANPSGVNFGNVHALIPGILLRVKGATIVIADIYDRPLYVIYNRIMAASGRSAQPGLE